MGGDAAIVVEGRDPATAPLDPKLLFTTLARHHVQFVLIAAVAAKLQGFPRFTRDADITPARERDNLNPPFLKPG